MSAVIALIIRSGAAFGLNLSPFWAGAAIVALLVGATGIAAKLIHDDGYARAGAACEAKALRARLDARTIERDSAIGRAERAEERVREATDLAVKQAQETEQLREDVKRLQSTKQGAKRDPSALMDDRCNATGAGARRLR